MTTLIVLKQTTALGPERTVLARFNLVCLNVLMSLGRRDGGGLTKYLFEGCITRLINSYS